MTKSRANGEGGLFHRSRGTPRESWVARFTVALALGLRRGEALGLKWDDVDFETSALYVQRSLQRDDNGPELVDVKTKKSRRAIPLPLIALRSLQKHRQRR